MNPLTQVKQIQKMSTAEASQGVSEGASWHAKYKDSAYVFVGGVPYDLTEGDLLAVFAQYGEVVDVNLVRDKATGKSKGFAFLAYEDQRSTILAVDNLNGAKVLGRIVRVDHVSKYKKKEEEDEEEEQRKREARGVCRAFQRGDCTRGASCKFSHNEMRSANTGWGEKDESSSRWDHDKYDGGQRNDDRARQGVSSRDPKLEGNGTKRRTQRDEHRSREHGNDDSKSYLKDKDGVEPGKWSDNRVKEGSDRVLYDQRRDGKKVEDQGTRDVGKKLDRYEAEGKEKGSSKHYVERKRKDGQDSKEKSSLRYEKKSRDRPNTSGGSDSSYDKQRKDKWSRDSGDDRSGQRHRDTHESSKRSRYEESSQHRAEDQPHHRRDRRQ